MFHWFTNIPHNYRIIISSTMNIMRAEHEARLLLKETTMSAMQDFYIAPISIDAAVAKAQADRSVALAALIRALPGKFSRLTAALTVTQQAGGKTA